MKKVTLMLAFALMAMFAFNNTAIASTTINFKLQIQDGGHNLGCTMPYYGLYSVTITIRVNSPTGTILCSNSQDNVVNTITSPNETPVSWVCSGTLFQGYNYYVQIAICRYDPNGTPQLSCCENHTQGPYTMADLTGGGPILFKIN